MGAYYFTTTLDITKQLRKEIHSMKMRLTGLIIIPILLTIFLAACGDETTSVPTYTGATTVTLSDSLKSKMTSNLTQVKNPAIEGYKTTDDVSKIKSTFDNSFKSAGWEDKSSEFLSGDNIKQLTRAGITASSYQKGDKTAIVMAFPNNVAAPVGFSGLNNNENAIMVISGSRA